MIATNTLPAAPSKGRLITLWTLSGLVALAFISAGGLKLAGIPVMVELFDKVGFGQWFRYFTGIVQITGSALLLIPWTARLGVALIGCTMLGAIILHLFVLSTGPFAAVVPAILLVFVIAVGWKGRGDTATPYTRIQI